MIVVIGAGITGLAAAWELARQPGIDVVVLEADHRVGGKLRTSEFAGVPVDEGADAFLARVPEAVELCAELGVDDRLVAPAERPAHVFAEGALRPLPEGHLLGVPTDVDALRATGIVSAAGIERLETDIARDGEPTASATDTTVGALVRGRLGDEVLDRLVGPLVGGINAGDPDRLSAAAVTPQLADAARWPSLVAGARAVRSTAAAGPVFLTLPDGLGTLPDLIAGALANVTVSRGEPALALERRPRGWAVHTGKRTLDAEAVVVTAPATPAAALLSGVSPEAAALLGAIRSASVVLATLAIDPQALGRELDGTGFLVPSSAGLLLTACSWATTKWPHLRPPDGSVLLRASAGRDGDARAVDLDDADLLAALLADLDRTMGLRGAPRATRVSRWPRSFPQYELGHLDRVAAIDAALARDAAGVVVAGAGLRGLGVPACIRQGREAAGRVAAPLRHDSVVYNSSA